MESEKVKEIKSVLESFAIDDKEMTLIQSPVPQNQSCMKTIKYADILTLINELESENERLRKENETLRNAKVVYENVDYCYEDLKKAENRVAELEKEVETRKEEVLHLQEYGRN